jgi:hypothetical protein
MSVLLPSLPARADLLNATERVTTEGCRYSCVVTRTASSLTRAYISVRAQRGSRHVSHLVSPASRLAPHITRPCGRRH